jgi:predicted Rossmann-fold nucleotide-binding protein
VLPGGVGTLNELIQALELKKHQKIKGEIYICNVFGFYDHFIAHLDSIVDEKFLSREKMDSLFTVVSDPEELFTLLHL